MTGTNAVTGTNGAWKCLHQSCRCAVPATREACSTYCRNAERDSRTRDPSVRGSACGCGHDDCRSKERGRGGEDEPAETTAIGRF